MMGRRLLHYEVLEKLGEGGMGVVYKARDTHLDRFIALKVLPPEAVAHPERKRRFVQEAKAASALNHPNIIHIYDISSDGDVDFIAMEYVAGKTLEALIGRRGLQVSDALKYAIPIAEALGKAHAAGIIHRDLKPGNVMVNQDGVVKVLDFGLAKLTEHGRKLDPEGVTETMPAAGPGTEEGTLLGTVAYMSPEQAEGKPVDSRTDIFSFGVMLYEMVTGRRAFHGKSKLSTLTSILHQEPTPPSKLAEGIPVDLEKTIARCLRKSADRRFQNMADLRIALLDLKEESDSGRAMAPAATRGRLPVPAVAAALGVAVAITAAVAWWVLRSKRPPQMPVPRALTFDSGVTIFPAISRDGKLLAYASDRADGTNPDIWVQQIDGGPPVRLTRHPAHDSEPDFSPDGTRIAFSSTRDGGGVFVIPTLGGDERKLADHGKNPRFSPDGKWIAYAVGEGSGLRVFVVPATGGESRRMAPGFRTIGQPPLWSPDGKHLLIGSFDATEPPTVPPWDWWACPLDGGAPVKTGAYKYLVEQGVRITMLGDWFDDFLYLKAGTSQTGNVWRVPLSSKTFQASGPAQRVTSGTGDENMPRVSAAGDVVFAAIDNRVSLWGVGLDAQGKASGVPERLTADTGQGTDVHLSRDGKKMVFASRRSGDYDVWMKDLETGKAAAVVAGPADEQPRKVTADGSGVIYGTIENQKRVAYQLGFEGGMPRKLCEDCCLFDVSSDDTKILTCIPPEIQRGMALLDLRTGARTELLRDSKYDLADHALSPDGHWIAFRANLSPEQQRLFVIRVRAEGPPIEEKDWIAVSDARQLNYSPRWSPDGSRLYFISGRDGHRCIWAQRLHPSTRQPAGEPFPAHHQHAPGHFIWFSTRIDVAHGRLVMWLADARSNIWRVKIP